jgi:chromosome segregation ATPase
VNWKITTLEKQKDSAIKIIEKKDAEIQAKSLKITALTKQASTAKANDDELLFEQSCDSLIPQVNDLVEAVDVLQQDNRNVQNAYDSLLGATSLKMGRLEYDYSELQERFDRVSKNANGLETSNHKLGKKADKRIILGFQVGGTYSIQQNKPIPYAGFGVTYRIARF